MFFLGLTIGLIAGVAFHLNRTKAQYAAFIAARAQLRIEQRRIENMKARQQRLKTMLEVSRSGGRLNFGESAPLPAAAVKQSGQFGTDRIEVEIGQNRGRILRRGLGL